MNSGADGWPSGWNVYYIAVLAGGLALLIPVLLFVISRLLSQKKESSRPEEAEFAAALIQSQNPTAIGRKTNPRTFQAVNAAIVLILLALLMIPCAATSSKSFGLVCILSFSLLAGLALFYGVRKGDLDSLRSYRERR